MKKIIELLDVLCERTCGGMIRNLIGEVLVEAHKQRRANKKLRAILCDQEGNVSLKSTSEGDKKIIQEWLETSNE